MRYVSLDVETTGLDPQKDQVLEIGMVIEDTSARPLPPIEDLPTFRILFRHPSIVGSLKALEMNWNLLHEAEVDGVSPQEAWHQALLWLVRNGVHREKPIAVAGKNVAGFDLQFFPKWLRDYFHHRTLGAEIGGDIQSYWECDYLPSLGDLLGRPVMHTAVDDARAVIEVLRRSYGGVR